MARKALVACNGCGALEEVNDDALLGTRVPDGWFQIKVTWPALAGFELPSNRREDWLVCSPKCFTTLADVTAERLAELDAATT